MAESARTKETVLIVGVGRGLSASLARLLAKEGFNVALAARNTDKLAALVKETGAHAFKCDATDASQLEALFQAVERECGIPSLVVFNAGFRVRGPLVDLDPAGVQQTLLASGFAGFLVAQAAAK